MDPTIVNLRNLAGVLLALEAFIFLLPMLIITYLSVRGLSALRARLANEWFPLVRTYVTQAETTTKQVSALVVEPPIRVKSTAAGVQAGIRHLVGRGAGPAST
jgi:hypothetical protein